MELSEWKRKKTTDLSKGMQQKVQFIATVLHDPAVLILDEPFSGLDPINVEFLIGVIDEYRTADKTIIFSTHLMSTAEKLCKDIILINKAEKVLGGSLREIKESYGKNLVAVRGTNLNGVLNDRSLVARTIHNADELEVELAHGIGSGALLRKLVDSKAEVTKFEEIEPSLNDIFIDKVKGADA
jgi:ABC-2 type transport system ATP-binding protein